MEKRLKPLFSIGVTTYNRIEMLKECLQSIINQSFSDFEIIVGNDYTQHHLTPEKLGIEDSRILIINNTENLGEINNMNVLLAQSRGKYFTWLADDDIYTAHYLSAINDALTMFDFTEAVFTSYSQGNTVSKKSINYQRKIECLSGQQFLHGYLSKKFKTIGCYGAFNVEYLKQIGGIEQLGNGLSPYSDNLLAIRAGMLEKVVLINEPLVFFRTHDQSISFTSGDIDAYKSAQEDLLGKCIEIFKTTDLKDDFNHNIFWLMNLFISHFFAVLKRSGKLQLNAVLVYFIFIFRNLKLLKNYRCRILSELKRNVVSLFKYWYYISVKK